MVILYLYLLYKHLRNKKHCAVLKKHARACAPAVHSAQYVSIDSVLKSRISKSCLPYEYLYYKTLVSIGLNMSMPIYRYDMTSYNGLKRQLNTIKNLEYGGYKCNLIICYDTRYSIQEIKYLCSRLTLSSSKIFFISRLTTPISVIQAINAFTLNNSYKNITNISLNVLDNFSYGVFRSSEDVLGLNVDVTRTFDIDREVELIKASVVNSTNKSIRRKVVFSYTFGSDYISLTRKDNLHIHMFSKDRSMYVSVNHCRYNSFTYNNVLYIECMLDIPAGCDAQVFFGISNNMLPRVGEEEFNGAVSRLRELPNIKVSTSEDKVDHIINNVLPMQVVAELIKYPFDNLNEIKMFKCADFGVVDTKYKYLRIYIDMINKAFGMTFCKGGMLPSRSHYYDGEVSVNDCRLKVVSGAQNYVKIDSIEYSNFSFFPFMSLRGREVVVCNELIC